MTFLRPDLLATAPVVVLLLFLSITAQWRRGRRLADAYGGLVPAARLTGVELGRFPVVRTGCLVFATMLLSGLAAGPERDEGDGLERVRPTDLVIVVDASLSMTALDAEPSRIGRARATVDAITEALPADRIALSLFADWPYRLVPLTDDPNVIRFFTPWVVPDLLGDRDQGTSLASAVSHAHQTLEARDAGDADRIVLLITDGETHDEVDAVLDSIAAVVSRGTSVWTAGVGSAGGAPLFALDPEGERREGIPLLDDAGEPVVARYDQALLRDLAEAGGGVFHDVSSTNGVRALIRDLSAASGLTEEDEGTSGPSVSWFILLAMSLLLWDMMADSGRRAPRLPFTRASDDS
jgi:Ca-activated chloride channel family protein